FVQHGLRQLICWAVVLNVNLNRTTGGGNDPSGEGLLRFYLHRGNRNGDALDGAEIVLAAELNGAVLHHEFGFCDGIGFAEVAAESQAKNGSSRRVNGNFTVIRGGVLEDATAYAAEFDLVMRRTHGNLKTKHRHRIGRALLPMTPRQLAMRQIGEDGNEDRAEFAEGGQAGDS